MQRPNATFTEPFIQLTGVSLSIDGVQLLKDVHLAVGRGEILAIMGPSGEGKSLLLKVIAGLMEPTIGDVVIDGRRRGDATASERRESGRRTGMLFQRGALFDSLTALENVSFPQIETLGLSRAKSDAVSHELLKSVGLDEAAARYPSEISGGMQKRLAIARAVSLAPNLILYDDPTAGLDPITSRKIIRLIRELQERDQSTVIVVSNETARAFQVADRLAFVFRGELVVTGTVEETRNHPDPRVVRFLKGQSDRI